MRIAFVVGAFPEVSTTFIMDQVTGLLDLGHDVHVFARAPLGKAPVHADFERYGLAERTHYWWSSFGAARDVARDTLRLLQEQPGQTTRSMLRAFDPRRGVNALIGRWWSYAATIAAQPPFDVVLAQFGPNGRIALTLRDIGAFDAPIATTWLGYDLSRILKEEPGDYYDALLARTELQLPLSNDFRARLLKLGCAPEKMVVHPIGIDVSRFAYAPRALAAGDRVRIITVCRLVEKKGLEFGLQALARVAASGLDFEYHLVGDGPLRSRLERVVKELGLANRVTMHGARARDDVASLLASSHIFLSPSVTAPDGDEEGLPTAIKEANAVGLPVISTRHAAIPELIEHGVSGLLVDEWDVAALREAIAQLLREPESWAAMARAARDTVERDYDLSVLNRRLAETLGTLASR